MVRASCRWASDGSGRFLLSIGRNWRLALCAGLVLAVTPLSAEHPTGASHARAQSQQTEEVLPLEPGEAVVTRFSHTMDGVDAKGNPVTVINPDGTSVSIIDIRNPAEPPIGQHWIDEPQRMFVTARDVGQVFGVAIARRPDSDAPTIFVSATAAYGLHRLDRDWMEGMWGTGGGPGTIYRLSPENGYKPEKFADVTLQGRENTGASLGNIAYDSVHDRLFVSDLETGMIHAFDAGSGDDLGTFDHGADGRADFLDVWTQQQEALNPVSFDPATEAQVRQCGNRFTRDPSCWNIADFRRRVWGLKIRTDADSSVRLFYSVWGSDAYGNPDWAQSGDDRRNSVWSIGLAEDGSFDLGSVRREFFMPGFWPDTANFGDKADNSNPVSDITFPECSAQNVMLVAERGGMRNLGLDKDEPFANPYESRVLRYELSRDGTWRPKGRYDVGFHDRSINDGEPFLFANASGGVDFGYKMDTNGVADPTKPSQSVWVTGDALCSSLGLCSDSTNGVGADKSEVHGLQGMPVDGFVKTEDGLRPVAADRSALFLSYMIDTDINIDENGDPVPEELSRNDATKIGDVAIYQACEAPEPAADVPPDGVYEEPPEDWPVHSRAASHNKWASSSHRVRSSWHYRNGSWHDARRSWHWRDGSWHQRDRSWHRRNGSWHDRERSWHYKSRSFHSKRQSWGDHEKGRSFHNRQRSWDDGHRKDRSYHVKGRTWDSSHRKDRSFHVKGRTWDNSHRKDRSFHNRGRSWNQNEEPAHKRRDSQHVKGRSFNAEPIHTRARSQLKEPIHTKARSADKGEKVHNRRVSKAVEENKKPKHALNRSRQENKEKVHNRRVSQTVEENKKPKHVLSRSRQENKEKVHNRAESRAANKKEEPRHSRARSAQANRENAHNRNESRAVQRNDQPKHLRRASQADNQPKRENTNRHSKRDSNAANRTNDAAPAHRRRLSQQQGE